MKLRINFKNLTVQVVIAIVLGILLGHFFPATGEKLKVLGDAFIKLIKMVIAPHCIFYGCTRDCRHGGHEKGRSYRWKGSSLF